MPVAETDSRSVKSKTEPDLQDLLQKIPYREIESFRKTKFTNLNQFISLIQFPTPPLYIHREPSFLSGYKTLNKIEKNLAQDKQLGEIVYCEDLLPTESISAKLEKVKIDINNEFHYDFLTFIHPWHTTKQLTPRIHSEKDTEKWVEAAILRPCTILLNLLLYGTFHKDLFAEEIFRKNEPIYTSSFSGLGTIPDFIINLNYKNCQGIKAVVEVKPEDPLLSTADKIALLRPLQVTHKKKVGNVEKYCPGLFKWSHEEEDEATGTTSKVFVGDIQTKLLMQVINLRTSIRVNII